LHPKQEGRLKAGAKLAAELMGLPGCSMHILTSSWSAEMQHELAALLSRFEKLRRSAESKSASSYGFAK